MSIMPVKIRTIIVGMVIALSVCTGAAITPHTAWAALDALPEIPAADAVLTQTDLDLTKKALKDVRKKRWTRARRLMKKVGHPLPHKLLDWLYFIEPGNSANFSEIENFVRSNPSWPRQISLLRQAEAAIDKSIGTPERLAWFEQFPPRSGTGRFRYAEALMHAGRKTEATQIVQQAWINDNFPYRTEREFHKRFRKYLTLEDHQNRIDRLLWEGRRQPARRMLDRVGKDWRRLANARLALRQRSADVDGLVARVPADLKDHPGLIYERARWRRKKKLNDTARELLLETGVIGNGELENRYAERIWVERSILTRKALANGEISNAYQLASQHGLSKGAKFADAEWLAGWIALRYLEDHEPAYRHFLNLHETVRFPISVSRAAYWAARAAQAMGNQNLTQQWFTEAAKYSTTFYGQLAAQQIASPAAFELPGNVQASSAERTAVNQLEIVQVAQMLAQLGEDRRINSFILRLYRLDESPGRALLTAELARKLDRRDLGVLVTKRAAQKGAVFPDQGYPVIDLPDARRDRNGALVRSPETALILALSRQESAFNP